MALTLKNRIKKLEKVLHTEDNRDDLYLVMPDPKDENYLEVTYVGSTDHKNSFFVERLAGTKRYTVEEYDRLCSEEPAKTIIIDNIPLEEEECQTH